MIKFSYLSLFTFWREYFDQPYLFLFFPNFITLKEDMTLHLNKFDSSFYKDALCQVLLKLAKWF